MTLARGDAIDGCFHGGRRHWQIIELYWRRPQRLEDDDRQQNSLDA